MSESINTLARVTHPNGELIVELDLIQNGNEKFVGLSNLFDDYIVVPVTELSTLIEELTAIRDAYAPRPPPAPSVTQGVMIDDQDRAIPEAVPH